MNQKEKAELLRLLEKLEAEQRRPRRSQARDCGERLANGVDYAVSGDWIDDSFTAAEDFVDGLFGF